MPTPSLSIRVSTGVGSGPTALSAFDAALYSAGVANFNLLRLSSVIPLGASVEVVPSPELLSGRWGDRLYVVYAEQRAVLVGEEAWAAVGWVQDPRTGAGLFVEHEGGSEDFVRSEVLASINALQEVRGVDLGEPSLVVQGARCSGVPVCALAVAVFGSEPWGRSLP